MRPLIFRVTKTESKPTARHVWVTKTESKPIVRRVWLTKTEQKPIKALVYVTKAPEAKRERIRLSVAKQGKA